MEASERRSAVCGPHSAQLQEGEEAAWGPCVVTGCSACQPGKAGWRSGAVRRASIAMMRAAEGDLWQGDVHELSHHEGTTKERGDRVGEDPCRAVIG
jgi:hypothetical protein